MRSPARHIRVGAAGSHKPVLIFVAGADLRIVSEDEEFLRALAIDASRDY
jgi:hypothetical protein